MKNILKFLIVSLILFSFTCFSELERKGIALTVYNQNFALVSDVREGKIKKGKIILKFSDIASLIDPTSVSFTSLNYPEGVNVMEQNFEYDLLNPDKLLNRYIDKEIQVITKDGQIYRGKLLSYNREQLIIKSNENKNISMVNRGNIRDITFVKIPEGLILKPTLVLEIESKKVATHLFHLKYITDGINWKADYVAELSPDDKKMDLTGWVTINNRSGTTYKNAKLKLIAGEVRKIRKYYARRYEMKIKEKVLEAPFPQFEEKPFFEYHMYTLTRPTTLKNNQTKQITFLLSSGIPVKKKYVYDGAVRRYYHYNSWKQLPYNDKVDVYIVFENKKENNLGIPLPKGKVRFYKKDTEGTSQFIGEDYISHTPKNEKVKLMVGKAFDIKGERKVISHRKISFRIYEDTYEIKLRNHKNESIKVEVIEHLYGDWQVLKSSHKYEKVDARTIKFIVEVKPEKEVKVTYTALYKF